MSNKELLKQLELEKQRRANNRANSGMIAESDNRGSLSSENRYAWEYELEAYRAQRQKSKWLVAGALCGVLSLILEVVFHWGTILSLTGMMPIK